MQDFIDKNPNPETKAIAQNRLGELRLEELTQSGAGYDSPLALRISEKARTQFEKTIEYATQKLESPNLDQESRQRLKLMIDQAELNMGKSYMITNRETAENKYFKKLQKSENNQIRSEANRLFALSRLEENPTEQVQFALKTLEQAVKEDPNNKLAAQTLKTLKLNLITARKIQFQEEGQRYLEDFTGITGEGFTSIGSGIEEVFSPVSKYYYEFFSRASVRGGDLEQAYQETSREYEKIGISGRLKEHLLEMQFGLEEIDVRRIGIRSTETLIVNDINMNKYLNSDFTNKFQDVMSTHNFDTYISAEEFGNYAKDLRFEERTINQDLRTLHRAIAKDKGKSIADQFVLDFGKTTATMGSIEHATKNDPMVHLIAGNGNEILNKNGASLYEGSQSLSIAFTTNRVGDPIERTWTEAIGLETGDLVLTAIATGGTGGFLAKGAVYTGRAIGLGAKTAKVVSTVGNLVNPGRLASLKLLGESAPKTRLVLELIGNVGAGFSAPFLLPIEAAVMYDVAGMIIPGGKTGKKISKVVNEAGDARLFIHAANEKEATNIVESLINTRAKKRTDLGTNIYELDNEIIEVGTKVGSGFKVTSTHDLNFKEYEVFGNSEYLLTSTSKSTKTEVRPGVTYASEYKKKLSRAESTIEFSRTTKNVDSDGRILTSSKKRLKEGNYIWTVDKNGDLRTASIKDNEGKRNIHAVLAEGQPLPGAGQFRIDKNGDIIEVTPQTGHYYPGSDINPDTGKILGEEFNEQSKTVFELAARKNGISIDKATFSRTITKNTNGAKIRSAQQILADNARRINLPPNEVARIRAGNFNPEEIARINRARKLLEPFEEESRLLSQSEHQQELLLGHYADSIIAKTRPLRRNGFSKESIRVLTNRNNMILGNRWKNPRIIGSVEAIEKNNLGEIVGVRTISNIQDAVSRSNVDEIFTNQLRGQSGTENIFGTKAVVYKNNKNEYVVAFSTESINTHHSHIGAELAKLDGWDPELARQFSERGYYGKNRQLLERESGFQLIFDKETGKITNIEMSSTMTGAQIGENIRFDESEIDRRIEALFNSIEPNLLNNELINSNWLRNPELLERIKPKILIKFILILFN